MTSIKAKNSFDLRVQIQKLEREGFMVSVNHWKLDNRGISTNVPESYRAYKGRNSIGLVQIKEIIIYP